MTENQLALIEQNLQEKRLEISQYMQEVNNETDIAISQRLQRLYQEYSQLQTQISILRSNAQACDNIKNGLPAQPTQPLGQYHAPIKTPAQPPKRPPVKPTPPPREHKNIEQTLGKNVMGIVASILIFIAMTLFAIVILPNMTDTIKMIGMLVISGAVTGFGMFLMNKDPKNAFNASVAGCGIGAIFISLLTMRIYFNAIGDYTLYFLLLWWTAAIGYISKNKHKMFIIIGEVGITISSLMGLFNTFISASNDIVKASALLIFTMVASAALYIFNNTGDLKEDKAMHLFHSIRSFIIIFAYEIAAVNSEIMLRPTILLFALIVLGIYAMERSVGTSCKQFLLSIYAASAFFVIKAFVYDGLSASAETELLCLVIISSVILNLFVYKYKDFIASSITAYALLLITMFCVLIAFENATALFVPFVFFVAPIFALGYLEKGPYQIASFLTIPFFSIFVVNQMIENEVLPFISLLLAIVHIVAYFITCDDAKVLKVLTYIYSITVMPFVFAFALDQSKLTMLSTLAPPITFWCLACLFLFASKKIAKQGLPGMKIINNILMVLIMIFGSIMVHFYPWSSEYYGTDMELVIDTMGNVAAVVTSIILIAMNVLKTMDVLKQGKGMGILMSLSYTVSLWSIILRISEINYIFSLAMLLLAIFTIMFGFKVQIDDTQGNKEMRIFGLTLSMITTVKLLMLDIEHNNMIETAIYLLLAGILCFVISFIYNKLDKNINKE